MQRDSSNYLEYSPNLQYTKDATVSVDSSGTPIASPKVTAPAELTALKERPSSAVLKNLQAALDAVSSALQDATKNLATDVANGVSFPEYIEARKTNPAKARSYEAAHQESITGSPAMDVVPALLDTQEELTGLQSLMADRFYNGQLPRNLDDAATKEAEAANALINTANAGGTVPLDQIRMDNTLRDVISDRVSSASDFVTQAVTLLDTSLADDTGNRPTVAVQALVSMGDLLSSAEDLNKLNFDKQQEDFANQSQRMGRLTPVSLRVGVPSQLSTLQTQALQYKAVVDHLASSNIGSGHPAAVVQNNMIQGLKKIHDNLRMVSVDAYKLNLLQEQQGQAFLTAVNSKRLARQMHTLIGDVKRHYDPNGPTGLQVTRIANLQARR